MIIILIKIWKVILVLIRFLELGIALASHQDDVPRILVVSSAMHNVRILNLPFEPGKTKGMPYPILRKIVALKR